MRVGLFYGSTTGNTERAAKLVHAALVDLIAVFRNIKEATAGDLAGCEGLIFGISTWEEGEAQEHWKDFLPELEKLDLHGRTVALFGLGDQEGYSGRFQDAMGTLYGAIRKRGATVVGDWPIDGYRFATSTAVVGGRFVGLALDEDTQAHLTAERIQKWAAQIRPLFS